MRNLLIVGCGDVVRRALPMLARRWRIIALVRQHDQSLAAAGAIQIVGDLDQARSLHRIAGLADAVIHSAPPPSHGDGDPRTRRLLAALLRRRKRPSRIVYISTTGVYGDCGGAWVDETRPSQPISARARRRVDAEQRLRRWGRRPRRHIVILRAPGIYAANRLPLERLHKKLPVLMAHEDTHTNHIHADDLALACVRALHRGGPNRCYNICDDSAMPMSEWFDLLAESHGLEKAPRISRAEAERILPPMQWSFMRESRRLRNERMKRELGLVLRYPTVVTGIDAALSLTMEPRPCFG
jgi:nucleoside-diphosphate-sugar epimerase